MPVKRFLKIVSLILGYGAQELCKKGKGMIFTILFSDSNMFQILLTNFLKFEFSWM